MTGFGIDLGTANTVVCHGRRGVVLDEPSVMVVRTGAARARRVRPLLVGEPARDLMGRCPVGLSAVRPLHDGVIIDLESARAFVVGIMASLAMPAWQRIRPRAVIGVPAGATSLERRALLEVADEQLVLVAQAAVERQRHLVAGDPRGAVAEHAPVAERGDLRGAPSHVDHHVGAGIERVHAAADRAGDRLVERGHRADARLRRGFEESAVLQR